jgi:prevent-host-death family protein
MKSRLREYGPTLKRDAGSLSNGGKEWLGTLALWEMTTSRLKTKAMKTVNIAELKNRLSHYLRIVRRGEPVLVRDRNGIIARIEPAGESRPGHEKDSDRLRDLELKGIVRPGRGGITLKLLTKRPKVNADVLGALLQEREQGF